MRRLGIGFAAALALALAPACNSGTFVTVTLQATGVALSGVNRVDLDLALAGKNASARLGGTGAINFPTTTVLDIGSGAGELTIDANALDGSGAIVAHTSGTATVTRGKSTTATLDFASSVVGGGADMAGGACAACDPKATCAVDELIGAATCTCPAGYSGDGTSCTDINECTGGTATCDANATCTNNVGSYDCTCNSGYAGNGFFCTQIWVPARSDAGVFLQTYGGGVGAGNRLYYFSPNNTAANVRFRSWDVTTGTTGTISDETLMPAGSNDFCNCGYSSKLLVNNSVSPPTLYYFANYGQAYNTSTKAWSTVTAYSSPTDHRRGETGITIYNQIVYWLGDRTPTTSIQTYAISTNVFGTTTAYPIGIDQSAVSTYNGVIYSFGGTTVGNVKTHASYAMDPSGGSPTWTPIADAPNNIDYYPDVVTYQSKLWVTASGGIYAYSPQNNTWSTSLLAFPPGGSYHHLAVAGSTTPGLYLLQDEPAGVVIYKYNLPN